MLISYSAYRGFVVLMYGDCAVIGGEYGSLGHAGWFWQRRSREMRLRDGARR